MVYIPYLLCKAQELQVVDNVGVVTEGAILLMTTQFKKDYICPGCLLCKTTAYAQVLQIQVSS